MGILEKKMEATIWGLEFRGLGVWGSGLMVVKKFKGFRVPGFRAWEFRFEAARARVWEFRGCSFKGLQFRV